MFFGMRWGGLRAKIIAWSFVPTAIILTAVALVGFYAYQQVTETLTVESSREVARLSAGQLGAELNEYSDTLTALARTADIYGNDAARRRAALARASHRLVIFDGGVLLLDNYGTVVAAQPARPEILGQDWSTRAYFQQIVRVPGTVYSNVVNDGPAGAPVIVVAVPITSEQGEWVGTLAGMFRVGASSVSSFYGSIVRLRIGANDSAYLVDGNGRVFYHTDDALIGQNWKSQPVVQQVTSAKAGAMRTRDLSGRDVVASFAPVPGTPWGLVTEQSWDVLLAPGQRYIQFLFLLLVLGLLVPAVVVMFGVRKITDPINRLIDATQKTARGNLGQKITVQTGDELEELGKQFNLMSDQLAASYDELKTREERFALAMQGTNDGIWDWDLKTDDVYYSPRWKNMLGYDDHELPNRFETWRHLLHPEDVERALTALRDYLERRSPMYQIDVRMRHKDGSYRWISTRGGALRDARGKAYRMTGSHTDVTERRQSEEKIRRQNEYLAALHETALGVMSRLQVRDLLETTVERAVRLVGATDGFVYLVTPDGNALESTVETGLYRRYIGLKLNRGEGLSGKVWETGQPLAAEDYQSWTGRSSQFDDTPIGPELGAPLKSGSEVVGVIGLTRAPGAPPFSQDEFELVSRFAQLASIALDNARLHTSLQDELQARGRVERAAALGERSRLARELHDSVTQSLYSVTLYAEAAARLMTAGDHVQAAEHLRELRDTAQEALREMRLLIFELRPPILEKTGLVAALQARLDGVETRGGMKAELQVEGEERLTPRVQEELYHIAQEALNNALKHSNAHSVQVHVKFLDDATCLEICDDGAGFELEETHDSGGLGFKGMYERAQRIGGELTIESAPGEGTRVRIKVSRSNEKK